MHTVVSQGIEDPLVAAIWDSHRGNGVAKPGDQSEPAFYVYILASKEIELRPGPLRRPHIMALEDPLKLITSRRQWPS